MHKSLSVLSASLLATLVMVGLSSCASSDTVPKDAAAPVTTATNDTSAVTNSVVPASTDGTAATPSDTPVEKNTTPEKTSFTDPLEQASFTGDFKQYQAGDIVPDLYRTAQYNISNWQGRKLPAPDPDTHWTYFGGSYVLISDAEGKISRIFSGDIIYR